MANQQDEQIRQLRSSNTRLWVCVAMLILTAVARRLETKYHDYQIEEIATELGVELDESAASRYAINKMLLGLLPEQRGEQ